MKVGIGSYAFRWAIGAAGFMPDEPMDVFSFLRKSADLGAEVVQICDNLPLERLDRSELAEVRKLASDLCLEVEIGIRGSRPEQIYQNLDICSALGARVLRVVLSDGTWLPTKEETIRNMQRFTPELKSREIQIAIENHFDMLPSELVEIVTEVNDAAVGVCLDPFNSVYRLIQPETTINLLSPYALTVHVKDATVSRYNTGFLIAGCMLGKGYLNLDHFCQQMRNSTNSPNLLIENWMDRCATSTETIKQEEEWGLAGLKFLKEKFYMLKEGASE